MAPQLRVLVSTDQAYPPKTVCAVNSLTPARVRTPNFDGEISVFVRDFTGEGRAGDGAAFFDARPELTFGIVVRGKYLDGVNGDDLVFGNVFEKPIRDHLPWGTSVATKFMYFIDPTLELDVYADKPWALSPALATMNHLELKKVGDGGDGKSAASGENKGSGSSPASDSFKNVEEDALGVVDQPNTSNVSARRRYFGDAGHRERVTLDKNMDTAMEFGSGILDFNTLSVSLPNPFPLKISLLSYWDGQAATYVCRRRARAGESPVGADGVYWSVAFEIIDEEATAALEKRGGKKVDSAAGAGEKSADDANAGEAPANAAAAAAGTKHGEAADKASDAAVTKDGDAAKKASDAAATPDKAKGDAAAGSQDKGKSTSADSTGASTGASGDAPADAKAAGAAGESTTAPKVAASDPTAAAAGKSEAATKPSANAAGE